MDWLQLFDPRRVTAASVQSWFARLILQNLGYKFLSILLALGIWGWVQGERVSEATLRVLVEYQMPDELVFSKPPLKRLRLTLSGPTARLRRLKREELSLSMDLQEAEPGVMLLEFPLEEILGIPNDVTIQRLVPNSVEVELERKTTRTVKLRAAQVGMPAKGYRIARIELEPEALQLRGPTSALDSLEELTTDGIPVDGLTETVEVPVAIHLPPSALERADDTRVTARVIVESLTETRRFEGVPVTVAQGWSTTLQAVDVILEGPVAALERLQGSDLTAIVRIPPETARREITVRHDPNSAARLDIVHPGGDEIVVQDIKPSRLQVSPR